MRVIAFLLLLIVSIAAQAKSAFKEGEHYVRLSTPVRTADPQKIEVTELFWYGCGHCYNFEPQLQRWRKTLPAGVTFMESPAMWRGDMETHARIFYTSKVLNVLDTMHNVVFEAMHIKNMKLKRTGQIQGLYEEHGISVDDFQKAFNSFSVTSLVNQAKARARGYGITGTPEIVVDGTYRISSRTAGSQANMLAVAEHLICEIHTEKKRAESRSTADDDGYTETASTERQSITSFCADYTQ